MFDPIPIHAWLIGEGLRSRPLEPVFEGLCERLAATPLAIERGHVAVNTLHPAVRGYSLTWRRRTHAIDDEVFRHSDPPPEVWQASPLKHMLEQRLPQMRRRLAGANAELDFPALKEFRAQGLTDWVAFAHSFNSATTEDWHRQTGLISTWATDAAEGFAEDDLARLSQIVGTFALAARATVVNDIAGNLVRTYVGGNAADRILAGAITRGSIDRIAAAILFADLRGSTALAEAQPVETVVALLNDSFDAMGGPIVAAGGEILKFMGDGLMAIFPVIDGPRSACENALNAAEAAQRAMSEMAIRRRKAGLPVLDLDIALHVGDVLYGNVGTQERLDFTVVGSAVNETARMEQLCKSLDRPILISASFARMLGQGADRLESLGLHALPGMPNPAEIFAVGGR